MGVSSSEQETGLATGGATGMELRGETCHARIGELGEDADVGRVLELGTCGMSTRYGMLMQRHAQTTRLTDGHDVRVAMGWC